MLDIRRLQVLAAVVDTGSVTAAATRLGYTPSSISQQLSTLERETGVPLFEKNGRGIRATDAGLLLAEHASTILRTVEEAEQAVEDIRLGRSGRVRVMSFTSAGDSLLPAAVAHLRTTQPGLYVATTIGETDQALQMLRDNLLDIALVLEPFGKGEAPDDDLVRLHLLDDPYRAMLPEGHPLAAGDSVELTDLAAYDWVAALGGNGFCRDDTVDLCRRAGFSPRFVAHAVEFPAAQAYIATGIGVGLVPELALGALHDGVVVRPLRRPTEPRHVWIVTRPGVAHLPSVKATVQALRVAAREHEERIAGRPHVRKTRKRAMAG
ncbi:MAG TPA: LysR family transcriptional regulator [Candidatus Nanopelagicales bacterium]|nr:LysR family transcriptional regulator [Candidatus Nanopelagicales bacterium]